MTRHLLARSLTKEQRRRRRVWLARRFGLSCAYCYRPFTFLEQATLDHVVPFSLYRTWSFQNLMLACRPCNQAKGNRLPLSLALLLVHAATPGESTANGLAGVAWPLLARLAAERQSAAREHQWATDEHPTGVREHAARERDAGRDAARHAGQQRERSTLRRERRRSFGEHRSPDREQSTSPREHPGRSIPEQGGRPDRSPTEKRFSGRGPTAGRPPRPTGWEAA
ncbi:HNH endonuclease signature motif containing protein [Streptomyces fungicidicus]|uniref:HNH endonuclease signature motif containing protein n=1 Tax=Streptomyces fungicidicus TaxID=68203 RepID=UPI00292A5AF9|nr:HNH endonuclease signature motif containing protein [Streptomyces fungicidicus]